MNKNFPIVSAILIFISSASAFADTSNPANFNQTEALAQSTTLSPTTTLAQVEPAAQTATTQHQKCFVKKVLGVVFAAAVGVPVCAVRKPIDEEKYEMKSFDCDKRGPLFVVAAAGLWIPFAVTAGVLEAPFFAVNNSLVNFNKPFSKEQFSLVETEESAKQ